MGTPSVKVTVADVDFTLAALTLDQAETIFEPECTDTNAQGREAVVASLQNGGNSQYTIDNIGGMPFAVFAKLRDAALKLNELAPKGFAAGHV